VQDLLGLGAANPIDVLQSDLDTLVGWKVNTSDTGQVSYSFCGPANGIAMARRRSLSVPMSPEGPQT
jgi:hypothetical protein